MSISKKTKPVKGFKGEFTVPGDKSISHRAIIISGITKGEIVIKGISNALDCKNSIQAMKDLGVNFKYQNNALISCSTGILTKPKNIIDVGNSGTTIRLLAGVLAGQNFLSVITGDESIRRRPMARVIEPLRLMGAKISSQNNNLAPLTINGNDLVAINYTLPIASAQVKSAILLAALFAEGETKIIDNFNTRDHTERMLKYLEADIITNDNSIIINPRKLCAKEITIPGDISSAAFFIVGALITNDSNLLIKNVGINKTRSYILDILKKMGGKIEIKNKKILNNEPIADIYVKSSKLKAVNITPDEIPLIIDEIPILSIACACANGISKISGASELRYKESDRIKALCDNFKIVGIKAHEKPDGLIIYGNNKISGGVVDSFYDHRIAMSFLILGTISKKELEVKNLECINTSFPEFFDILESLIYE